MDKKVEKPDYVLNFSKPVNTEIKNVGKYWYLYERSNRYDPVIKRSRKVSGCCLGKITAAGLVPSTKRVVKKESLILNDTLTVGPSLFLWNRTAILRERLKKFFPDIWEMLYTIAVLRIGQDLRFRRLGLHYENSLLARVFPNLSFHPTNVTSLLQLLGKRRDTITAFMKEDISQREAFILFDGHRLITGSNSMEHAELGYDSKKRYKPQTNLLYIYSLEETGYPVYYKQFAGSTPDVSAFSDILSESGIKEKNYTAIGDKGFASEEDFALMQELNLNYIVPLRRGNACIKGKIPEGPMGYTIGFTYHGRAIHANSYTFDGYNVHLYYDAQLYADECADAIVRMDKKNACIAHQSELELKRRENNKGRLTDEELAKLVPQDINELHQSNPEMGTISIRTNRLEMSAQQVYLIYKQRQAIEQFFKTYGVSMEFDASYMRNRTAQESWLFLNHLSAMIGVSLISEIAQLGESKNISLEDLMQTLRKITASKLGDSWQIAPIKKSVRTLLEKMQTDITVDSMLQTLKSQKADRHT